MLLQGEHSLEALAAETTKELLIRMSYHVVSQLVFH